MIYKVLSRETVSSVAASIGFTATKLVDAQGRSLGVTYALCQPISGDIRICVDGSTPTTSLGVRIPEDTPFEVWGSKSLDNFRCIDDGGTATLEVVYYGDSGRG